MLNRLGVIDKESKRNSSYWNDSSMLLLQIGKWVVIVQLLSRVQLCNSMNCSTPGLPVSHYLLEFAQVHVHCIGDAIQPSHPATLFFCCPQSFPASGSFPVSWLFASSGQSTGGSASAPVLPMYIQGWFPLGLTGLISSLSKDLSRVFSSSRIIMPLIRTASAN